MTRLYLNQPLTEKAEIVLSQEQNHYISTVLRYQKGQTLKVFNEVDGEWVAEVFSLGKKQTVLRVDTCLLEPRQTPILWLGFAPLKQDATNFLLEKATELGVTHLQPLWMERSNTQRLNLDRWQKIVTEASQQCERHDIPHIMAEKKLSDFLEDLPSSISWFVPLERQDAPFFLEIVKNNPARPYGFIIGPEGGFSYVEKEKFKKSTLIHSITLGPRILRAETAALTVLAMAQTMLS